MSTTNMEESSASTQHLRTLLEQGLRRRPGRELHQALRLLQQEGTMLTVEQLQQVRQLVCRAQARRPCRELRRALNTLTLLQTPSSPDSRGNLTERRV